jgi:hypothetical protein
MMATPARKKINKPRAVNLETLKKARTRFWKNIAREILAGRIPNTFTPADAAGDGLRAARNQFVVAAAGPPEYIGFFEQDGYTGYLYVLARATKQVIAYAQIYTHAARLKVRGSEVRVVWSAEGDKCGVIIRAQMRGIIDLAKDRPGRASFVEPDSPGVNDFEWLRGFEDLSPTVLFQ